MEFKPNPAQLPPLGGKGIALSVQQRRERKSVTAEQLRAGSWLSVVRAPTEPRPQPLSGALGRSLPLGGSLPLSGKPGLHALAWHEREASTASLGRSARGLPLPPPHDDLQCEAFSAPEP